MPARTRSGRKKYYNIYKGKFTLRASDDNQSPDVVERTNAEHKFVRELHYDALDDILLVDIKENDHAEYGKSYDLTFIDENEYIQVRFTSGTLADSFLQRLENIIIDKPISIVLYNFLEDGKEKQRLNVFQEGEKIARVYTKENPGALPGPEEKNINNKLTWDWSARLNYWTELINSLRPKLPGVHAQTADAAQEQSVDRSTGEVTSTIKPTTKATDKPRSFADQPSLDDETDDLPF